MCDKRVGMKAKDRAILSRLTSNTHEAQTGGNLMNRC